MRSQSGQYFSALTSVRGIAAWWVVLFHFRNELPNEFFNTTAHNVIAHGHLAVDLFFALSGFVIALNYADKLKIFTRVEYIRFLVMRFGRIYPLYLFMLLLFIINPLAIHFFSSNHSLDSRYDPVAYLLSLALIQHWGFYNKLTWNIPAWSISTEWAAYM